MDRTRNFSGSAKTLPTILDHLTAAQAIVEDLAREQVARSDPPPTKRLGGRSFRLLRLSHSTNPVLDRTG
jgi:hypothetical protein